MKKITIVLINFLLVSLSQAQTKAVTETGEEVILFNGGTWKYQNEDEIEVKEIPANSNKFKKNKESTFLIKSNNLNVGIYINPKKWSFKKVTDNSDAEYKLKFKDGDLYGMVITEKVEIPIESFKSIAIENGKKIVPDLKIVKEEYRIVNGIKVLLLQMDGTTKGIKVSYYGYYFSSINGTIQFVTYTSQNLMDSYRPESEKLLNGLVEIN
jgi:hypothetical protein